MSIERANDGSFWKGSEAKLKEMEKEWYAKHVNNQGDQTIKNVQWEVFSMVS